MRQRERLTSEAVRARLTALVERFAEADGRGVEEADEIDRLWTALTLCRPGEAAYAELNRALFGDAGTAQAERRVRVLEDPDLVGESSYRALYELMRDTFDSAKEDGDDPVALMVAELDSVLEHAAALREAIVDRYPIAIVWDCGSAAYRAEEV